MSEDLGQRLSHLPLAEALRQGDSVFSDEQKRLIQSAYLQVFHKSMRTCSCRNRYADALMELKVELKKDKKMTRKYMLFAGVIIWLNNECYSNHNLTDEIAEQYLALHPESKEKFFQLYPKDDEIAQEVAEETPTQTEEKPKSKSKKKTKK